MGWLNLIPEGLFEADFDGKTCMQCSLCCIIETVPLSPSDVERIKTVRSDFKGSELYTDKPGIDGKFGYCTFFSEDGCSIHDIKPEVCRDHYCSNRGENNHA